ncbi:MAG TPA: tetratricopeptide repeat protein [Flavobacteriales bacterium]|nr:tetratricopeptide repeat protein [Flavobacteriales bacterium]
MKRIILSAALLLSGATVFGQGNDRTNAIMAFKDYMTAIGDDNFDKAEKSLKEAKEYIDKAYAAAPTDHKTLYYKGAIYGGMASTYLDPSAAKAQMDPNACSTGKPKYKAGIDPKVAEAEMEKYGNEALAALKDAMKYPSKKDDFSGQIKMLSSMQSAKSFNCGSKAFNEKRYADAVEHFSESAMMRDVIGEVDSASYYYSALAYERLKDNENAYKMWQKCAEIKFGGADSYSGLANAAIALQKDAEALKAIQAGRAAYPKDQGLIIAEVNYHLGKGDNASAEKAIGEAIKNDPKNATLYFALGSVYDNLKNYAKAEESYKKAIEVDPMYFDALFNLGAMKYNEGAELMNKIKDIADDAEYTREKAKADEMFKQALPYNEKAREINPKDRDNLTMLMNIYARTGQMDKANELKKMLQN